MTSQHIILKRFKVHTTFSLQQFYQTWEGINAFVARYDKLTFYINLWVSFLSLSLIVILPPSFLFSFFLRSPFLISSVKTGISEEQRLEGNQEYPTPWIATDPAAALHGFQDHLLCLPCFSLPSAHTIFSNEHYRAFTLGGCKICEHTIKKYCQFIQPLSISLGLT